MYFGLPIGAQTQLESLAWVVFVLMIGSLGVAELTAHSIAMNIFMLAVMPMAGISVAVSVLVARRLGEQNLALAWRVTRSAMHIATLLIAMIGLTLTAFPDALLALFAKGMSPAMREMILGPLQDLLRMVVLYSLFQTLAMMLAGDLKGRGDTHFVAWAGIAVVWLILVVPNALMAHWSFGSLHLSWLCLVFSGVLSCIAYYLRSRWMMRQMPALVGETPEGMNRQRFETAD